MGNTVATSLTDYALPEYTTAPVAVRQPQDEFETRLEAAYRFHLEQVQQRYNIAYPNSADAAIDWAMEAPISALPRALSEATIECFRGATLMDLANLFGVPLNAQLLPDIQSLGIVRRNVTALHPDHRRERSADLYEAATVAYEQLSQLVMRQADLFRELTERDSAYHLDDRALPASLMYQPPLLPPSVDAMDEDGVDVAALHAAALAVRQERELEEMQRAIAPEEREAIRVVMRPVWGEHSSPSEEELREVKRHMRTGTLCLPTKINNDFALPGYDMEARARALALGLRDRFGTDKDAPASSPDEIIASGAALAVGQGAITSSALILPTVSAQPRFFQGHRVSDRTLVFAGDASRGGPVAFSGGGLTLSSSGYDCQTIGTPLSVAYRPRVAHDLTEVLPVRQEDNSDVTDKYEERLAHYVGYQNHPLALCPIRLQAPLIVNSSHNEARGDLAAARGRGITSLRPGGKGGVKRDKATPPAAAATTSFSIGNADDVPGAPEISYVAYNAMAEDVEEEDEEEDDAAEDGHKRKHH